MLPKEALALALYEGTTRPRNIPEAVRIWRELAERDNPSAMRALALVLLRGKGVPRDVPEATRWYRRSKELAAAGGRAPH